MILEMKYECSVTTKIMLQLNFEDSHAVWRS